MGQIQLVIVIVAYYVFSPCPFVFADFWVRGYPSKISLYVSTQKPKENTNLSNRSLLYWMAALLNNWLTVAP